MPLYDYDCPEHGVVPIVVPIDLRDCAVCPTCGVKVKRLFSPPRGVASLIVPRTFIEGRAKAKDLL